MRKSSPAASGWLLATHSDIRDGAQRGAVAALMALALPILIIAMGLVIDVAHLFWVRSALQAAADMAVLAGAQAIDLEQLAEGQRRIIAGQAATDVRYWLRINLESHPATSRYSAGAQVEVDVYNADPAAPMRQRWTNRLLTDPTVSVRVAVSVPTFFVRALMPQVPLSVAADASLLEKADPLPYDDDRLP